MRWLSTGRVARVEGPSRRCHQWPSANGRSHSGCRSWRSWERTARRSGDKLTLHAFIGTAGMISAALKPSRTKPAPSLYRTAGGKPSGQAQRNTVSVS